MATQCIPTLNGRLCTHWAAGKRRIQECWLIASCYSGSKANTPEATGEQVPRIGVEAVRVPHNRRGVFTADGHGSLDKII